MEDTMEAIATEIETHPTHSTMADVFPAEMKKELPEPFVNVGDAERWISALAGAALAAYGLKRGRWLGLAATTLGGSLMYRGVSGHCSGYAALGMNTVKE